MQFIKPDFENNFAGIPGAIARYFDILHSHLSLPESLLAPFKGEYESICLIFLDAFGWRFAKHFTEIDPIEPLCRLVGDGQLTRITSQFPSTTACHVTTINTGLPLWESCVCEWHYFESAVDRVITPLPFASPRDSNTNSLHASGVSGNDIFSEGWFYPLLLSRDIRTQVFQKTAYTASPFNQIVGRSANVIQHQSHLDGIQRLGEALLTTDGPTYTFYYFEDFDAAMHKSGPLCTESRISLEGFFEQFESKVITPLKQQQKKTLIIFTADHGMTSMDPATTRYVDQDIPTAKQWIRKTRSGEPILPVGSPRDFFLHVEPQYHEQALETLKEHYNAIAEVYRVEDMIQDGYFGSPDPCERFRKNIGDILIAPFAGESIYWLGENKEYAQKFYGHHGGLTTDEMESIFLVYPC